MLSHTKFQEVDTIICMCVNKGLPILITHIYKSNWQNLHKNILPVRPKTVLEIRESKKKKKEWQLQSVLRYTQIQ